MSNKINVFHIGPQKTATTWLYMSLAEHKEVVSSKSDSVHFFNMYFHKGTEWYHKNFENLDKKVIFDPTPAYIRDKLAPQRIFKYNPEAKIMLTARNPLERAFSHYWHEKKKDRFDFKFEEIFDNYDLYANWIEPGLYAAHLKRYLEYFPPKQIKVLFFDDLDTDPGSFLKSVFEFCEIERDFVPSTIGKKLNTASGFRNKKIAGLENKLKNSPARPLLRPFKGLYKIFIRESDPKNKESLADIDPSFLKEVLNVFEEDINELERMCDRDLSHWKNI